jgi:hypothetical protein
VVYVYANDIERRNWNLVFAGLAFWGMDWLNEIWNGLVFHAGIILFGILAFWLRARKSLSDIEIITEGRIGE